jgi:hypothetical protein
MGSCVAKETIKNDKGEWVKEACGKETDVGYRYCDEHKTRKRALDEREDKSLSNIVDASEAFTPSFVPEEKKDEPFGTAVDTAKAQNLPAARNKNIYDKTADVLDQAIDWQDRAWKAVMALSAEQFRYEDKAGAEQLHSFVAVYERAMDRTIRAVTAVAKLNIDAQSVNVNKMVQEVVKSVVTKALTRAGFEQQQIEQVRMYMAEEFERVAQEAG